MREYKFKEIEAKWQTYWEQNQTYTTHTNTHKPTYYVLDMFPYPSGAGLHVGHPLGYIASDIIARYKRLQGFEVLHPMGFDAFGLPAEQYAIETGNHPDTFTNQNIDRYRQQLKSIALSYDWQREIKTSDPNYYKWTQWMFIQFFNAYYNQASNNAEPIVKLIQHFQNFGTENCNAFSNTQTQSFSSADWQNFSDQQKAEILNHYRIAYQGESEVNWCEALGTVLSNDEVINGVSERGGHPVIKRKMKQWFLRITAYADQLLDGLNTIDWSEAIKEVQRNWIGKSVGAEIVFSIEDATQNLTIFTTRPETIFGCTYLAIAADHPNVQNFIKPEFLEQAQNFITNQTTLNEKGRLSGDLTAGVFTGSFAKLPFNPSIKIPIYIASYVLGDYGTGAIMAVPAHDSRDYAFAKKHSIEIKPIIVEADVSQKAYEEKTGMLCNSEFLDNLSIKEAAELTINRLEAENIGKGKTNYRLRDANFGRQRYWGEPIPIIFEDNNPTPDDNLPVILPQVESYQPAGGTKSPLASATQWLNTPKGVRETDTMPGWAGSSWYYYRYIDPSNSETFADKSLINKWKTVDFYVGGAEHGTGHLLYARFWNRVLFDLGFVAEPEPFKKLINQGMIQGRSALVFRINGTNQFVSYHQKDNYETTTIRIDVNLVNGSTLRTDDFKYWRKEFAHAEFILEPDGTYIVGHEVEKMSKRWHNVVTPDEMIERYGCDAFRLYEMFLGPVEASKPWNTEGIDGVSRFLRKLWNLFFDAEGELKVTDNEPSAKELKVLHKTIKKVQDDIERFNLNTIVSAYMIAVNELTDLGCKSKSIFQDFLILLCPYAPHIAEELWQALGNSQSVTQQSFPIYDESKTIENQFEYPVSINGKLRTKLMLPLAYTKEQVEDEVKKLDLSKWIEDKPIKKLIVVHGKIINVVV